jgi:hypothetical protein
MFARKLVRALAAALLTSAVGIGATASLGSKPVLSSVDQWIVDPGRQDIVLTGSNFASVSGAADCKTGGAPQVAFLELAPGNNTMATVGPKGTDAANCSDTRMVVSVPPRCTPGASNCLTGSGARLRVTDGSSQANTSDSNLQLTFRPYNYSVTPAEAGVGATVSVQGANLRPATVAPPSSGHSSPGDFSLTLNGSPLQANWTDSSISFSPGQASGSVKFAFNVVIDANNSSRTTRLSIDAGSFFFKPPQLNGGQLPASAVGRSVSLSGSWLGSRAGSVLFSGGGQSATANASSWNENGLTVTVPAGAPNQSTISVTVPGFGQAQAPGGPPTINLNPTLLSASPTTGSSGTFVTISGYNFGTSAGSVLVAGTPQKGLRWTDRAVGFTLDPSTETGAIVLNRPDGASISGPTLTVVPRLTRLETSSAGPGAAVVIDGMSFGSTPGTVTLGSKSVPTQLWSRESILFTVPAGTAPGHYDVVAATSAGVRSNPLAMTITAQPSPTPATTAGATPSTIGGVHVFFDNAHQFVKPPKGASPVDLTVTADPKKVEAGGTVNVTVTLLLNGKPVPDAKVDLSMVKSPGSDYQFIPASGTTDNNGVFKASVKVSKTPGDNIILASSGVFSDQENIVGTGKNGATAAPGATVGSTPRNRGSLGGLLPLVALGGLAAALVAGGLYLNLRSHA